MQEVWTYINDIKTGKIKACKALQDNVKRFEKDQNNPQLYFNEAKVLHVFRFFSHLQHTKDRYAGKNFVLLPWQKLFIANIFGWQWKETNVRRFTEILLFISKKNGKTALAAGLMLYCTLFEGSGNRLVMVSNSREQAQDIDFDAVNNFCINLDPEEQYLNRKHNTIHYANSVIKCISSENKSKDGLGLKVVYMDEFEEFRNWDLYNNLKSSQVDLQEKLFITTMTAGLNKNYPAYELYTTAKEINAGLKTDESFYALIFELDEEQQQDWTNPDNWIYSNPSLTHTVLYKNLEDEVTRGKNNKSVENDIKTKNFNVWCDTVTTWIPANIILNNSKDLNFGYYEGFDCVLGVDLSEVSDLTAVSWQFEADGNYHYITKYYLPVDNMNSTIDKKTYENWHKQGFITLQAGNRVDYEAIATDIQATAQQYKINILNIGYDAWKAKTFTEDMKTRGFNVQEVPQTVGKFSAGTLEFERLLLGGQVELDNNKITRWCFSNCVLRNDANGNKKPDKAKSSNKIDGAISILTALNCWMSMKKYSYRIG
jgi:phage terminase large subunit-like protein